MAGELEIRADQFQAFVGGRSVDHAREFELLELLAQAQGKVLQREEIYQAVWGYAMRHGDRSVDVFVRKVRQKLETASPDWSYIHTHFGVGYRFQPEPGGPDEAAASRPAWARSPGCGPAEPAEREQPLDPDLGDAKAHALLIDQPLRRRMSRNPAHRADRRAAVAAAIAFVIASPAMTTATRRADHRHHRDPRAAPEPAPKPRPSRRLPEARGHGDPDPRRRSGRGPAEIKEERRHRRDRGERRCAGRHPPARL